MPMRVRMAAVMMYLVMMSTIPMMMVAVMTVLMQLRPQIVEMMIIMVMCS